MEKVQVFHNGEQVWSVGHIDGNTFFGPFRGDTKKMVKRILNRPETAHYQPKTSKKPNDINLETDEQVWLPVVPGALCKWDPTMEMIRGPDNEIYLRTTRDILPREELRAWFSPSLERELGISKNDVYIKTKGNVHQCPTCDIINHRDSVHDFCKDDHLVEANGYQSKMHNSSSSSSPISSSYKDPNQVRIHGFESRVNHDELQSAFRRFASKKFPPFENPKLASLISSFSHPGQLKDASSESLADYHKKEFRKKFQGNEHYLRKHLYREGLEKCPLISFTAEEQHYIAAVSIQRPAVKLEKFETRCCDSTSRFYYPRGIPCNDDSSSSCRPEKNKIWNPFCSHPENTESRPKRTEKSTFDQTAPESENYTIASPVNTIDIFKITNDNLNKQESKEIVKKDDIVGNDSTQSISDLEAESEESHNIEENEDIQNENVESKYDEVPKRFDLDEVQSARQSSIISHCYYAGPWRFPNTMLSSLSVNDMSRKATNFASFSRYQSLQPFALPYGIPANGAQTRPRATQGFTCDFCGKVYCRKYVLKIHMRTHTGFKPLKCKFCDKSFSDPSNMKKHVKLHETENTVHKCKHCGRNFVRYRGLLNHIKSKHTEPLNMGILI